MERGGMKIKSRPKKPVRKDSVEKNMWLDAGYDQTVADLLDRIPPGVAYENVTLCFYEAGEINWSSPETDEEFAIRMKAYETKLANYEKWLTENKDAIEKELVQREEEKKEKQAKKVEELKRKLKDAEEELEKELSKQ